MNNKSINSKIKPVIPRLDRGIHKNINPVTLVISGFDPCNHAGYGIDIRTISKIKTHPVGIITSLTCQNPDSMTNIYPVNDKCIKEQLKLITNYYDINSIKIGMIYEKKIINTIYSYLKNLICPIIVDPVLNSTTNKSLLKKSDFNNFINKIIKTSTLITPNYIEALKLAGLNRNQNINDLSIKLYSIYNVNILIKGGHIESNKKFIIDTFYNGKNFYTFKRKKYQNINTHGSGCMLSSLIAGYAAKGIDIKHSIKKAENFMTNAFKNPIKLKECFLGIE